MGTVQPSSRVGFTVSKLAAFMCPTGKAQVFLWDSKTPSLALRVTATQTKSFIFESWFNGKSMRITLGDISSWSIPQAQAEARRLKVLIDQGIDPREERAQLNAAPETDPSQR